MGVLTLGLLAFVLDGCSPDLHETVGPLVPFPNVTGRVVRDGVPVVNIEVELENVVTDSTYDDDRTDAEGIFAFSEVGPGQWEVQVDSRDSTAFGRVAFEFVFTTEDTMLEVPTMDISLEGLALEQPPDGQRRPAPDLFNPMTFRWGWDDVDREIRRYQIRLYVPGGVGFWFSPKVTETRILWNGLGNQQSSEGNSVEPGEYRWQLRLEGQDGLEYTTADRFIIFE
jgi:hypothetical protein